MKKFFMVTPQQPEGMLKSQHYFATGNSLLEYGTTCFPIIPVINAYLGQDEEANLVTVTYDSEHCRRNLGMLRDEVELLCEKKGAKIAIDSVEVPFDDSVSAIVHVFQELINRTDDEDELFACITFGSKPMPLALVMALQYAYRIKSNVVIECVVYGQIDRSGNKPTARIYDVTALVQLDEIVRLLAERGVVDPESALKQIVGA